jgi:hypothetical protein
MHQHMLLALTPLVSQYPNVTGFLAFFSAGSEDMLERFIYDVIKTAPPGMWRMHCNFPHTISL